MGSAEDTTKLPVTEEDDKETMVVSIRIGVEDEKLVRRAAVELDLTRSDFMAEAAVDRARGVLRKVSGL